MIQDVGILAMVSEAADYYAENVLAHAEFPRVAAAERSCFGFSHVDVSLAIAKKWGLSEDLLYGIRHHHDASSMSNQSAKRYQGRNEMNARVLFAANLGAIVLEPNKSSSYAVAEFHEYLGQALDLQQSKVGN